LLAFLRRLSRAFSGVTSTPASAPSVPRSLMTGLLIMITISEDALALIEAKQSPLFIDIPHTVSGCCFEVTDCPSIHFGEPKNLADYTRQTLQNATVYVPSCFPKNGSHIIRARNILGFKRLVLSGWRLI
jgi:hypothetical protein